MNRHAHINPIISGDHYTVTADDDFLVSGWIDGNNVFHGKNRLGMIVHLPLDVPLCGGCDKPIADDGSCESCGVIHSDAFDEPLSELRPTGTNGGTWL